jgi:hypothetical protein
MTSTTYAPSDSVLAVGLHQTGPLVEQGDMTWEEAAAIRWHVNRDKADAAKILLGVYQGQVRGAWPILGTDHDLVPSNTGSGRLVNRTAFTLGSDERLAALLHAPLPGVGHRNPVAWLSVKDLPHADALLTEGEPPAVGSVRLGPYVLVVGPSGDAEVIAESDGAVTVRRVVV